MIYWLESVLYNPDGQIINDPLYTFALNDDSRPYAPGGGTKTSESERKYPPVEPYYEEGNQFVGAKLASGAFGDIFEAVVVCVLSWDCLSIFILGFIKNFTTIQYFNSIILVTDKLITISVSTTKLHASWERI